MSRRRPAAWLAIALLLTGAIAPATVVAASPDCPDDSVTIDEDGSASGKLACTDGDGDGLTYALETGASDGQAIVDSDGSYTYTPDADFNGSDSFTYSANDGTDSSAPATISITIDPINDAPSFNAGSDQTVSENASTQTVPGWATSIKKGPPNESGQTLSFDVSNNNNGLFATQPDVSSTGTLTYRPKASTSGVATVSVQLVDNGGTANGGADTSGTQTFTITVSGVNDPPSFSVGPDDTSLEDAGTQTVDPWATDISPGPSDESGQSVSFVVNSVTNSTLFATPPAVSSGGVLTYRAAANAFGTSTVTLHAHDSGGGSTDDSPTQSFTITVTPVNDAPSFTKGGDQSANENDNQQMVTNWATSISDGPSNESAQTVTFHVSNNNNGLFSVQPAISSGGTLTYTPAASENGSATVSVYLQDNGGSANGGNDNSGTQTFTITVSGVNDPPSFTKGANQVDLEDAGAQSVPGWATNISPGPSDESGQTVSFLIDSNSNSALFSSGPAVSPTGTLTYTPAANANGNATITLHAHDNGGGSTDDSPTQSFTIAVTAVNDPPAFTKGSNQTVFENSGAHSIPGWASAISEGPANESAQTVAFSVTNNTDSALFAVQPAVSPTGTLTFTPAGAGVGSATITIQLQDNGGVANSGDDTSATQSFTITVTGVNDPPTFTKGANPTVLEDSGAASLPGWATAISPGPSDESGQTVNFLLDAGVPDIFSTGPAISPGGTLTFTPAANANGTSTVTVSLHDNGGIANGGDDTSAAQTFAVTVTPVNDPPSFTKGSNQTVAEDSGLHTVANWIAPASIVKGPADEATQVVDFVIDSDTNPALFTVPPAVASDGTLSYTLAANANGSTTIGLHAHDNGGVLNGGDDTSGIQTFTISVTGANDAPTCTAGNNATFVNAKLDASITTCVDLDGDNLAYSIVAGSTNGATVLNSNGTFTYTPNTDFLGNDSFTFTATDGVLVSAPAAKMTIQVQADPIARNDVAPTDFPAIVQGSGPTIIPVLANDVDKQGGPLTIDSATQGAKGKVAISVDHTVLTYDPTGLASGTDSFRYTIVDNQNRKNTAIVLVVITPDTFDPVITAATVGIVSPTTLASTTGKVRVSWGAIDAGTGLKSIKVQEKIGTGAYKTLTLATPKAKSIVRSFTFGKAYKYRVLATDIVGNVSAYTVSGPFVIGRVQENSPALVYTGPWGLAASASYSAGKARWAQAVGASVELAFSGEGIAWVASKGATRGSAEVWIDGVLVKVVDLHATKTTHRQVVFSQKWTTYGAHSVKIVVLGTAVHPRIDLDTLVVAK